jgi:alpha-amylase/alpha-mannosidase (GH57 family)
MPTVSLALMWHQHQPYYPDDVGGENPMPWVRLHGTKDYLGMALHLEEVPEFRCTINLVPSLLLQLQAYVDGASDKHLRVSRTPADGLSHDDAVYLLDHFFMANHDAMIRPYPRYQELYLQRGLGVDGAEQALQRFRERDLCDLQVWSNLTWMHPLLFEKDPELAEFRSKGRRYTEDDKNWLLDKQRELLGRIIPLHRALADRGQVELTTTPYYHPILPLLLDKRLAREAMPDVNLPAYRDGYPEDAEVHVRRAVEDYRDERRRIIPAGVADRVELAEEVVHGDVARAALVVEPDLVRHRVVAEDDRQLVLPLTDSPGAVKQFGVADVAPAVAADLAVE